MERPGPPLTTWLLLGLGPLLALLASNLVLARWGAFWSLLLTLPQGSPHRTDALLHEASRADIVVLGSSVAVHGISAPALGGMLGGREVVNLGRNGSSLAATSMQVPRLLALAPQQVILLISPMELQPLAEPDWLRFYDPRVAAEVSGLQGFVTHPRAHLQGLAGWGSLLYRHTPGLRTALGASLPDSAMAHPDGKVAYMRRARQELSSLALSSGPNHAALHAIGRRLARAGVQLIAIPAPLHPALRDRGAEKAVFDALTDAQAEAEAEMVVISPRRLGAFAPALFADPYHLTPQGQRQLTAAIGAQLRAL